MVPIPASSDSTGFPAKIVIEMVLLLLLLLLMTMLVVVLLLLMNQQLILLLTVVGVYARAGRRIWRRRQTVVTRGTGYETSGTARMEIPMVVVLLG